jgi:hypothetical protein
MKRFFKPIAFLLATFGHLLSGSALAQSTALKPFVRDLFGKISETLHEPVNIQVPEGLIVISQTGVKGIRIQAGRFSIEPHAWNTPNGLIDQIETENLRGNNILAGINGAFYTQTGVLGPVIINGVPALVKEIPSRHPKCFLANVASARGRRWVIGESTKKAAELSALGLSSAPYLNRLLHADEKLVSLLGGGGWIIRGGKDVHMEAYKRQNFRFRKVDQDARHSVVAMDIDDNVYLLVFETGYNLEGVSAILRQPKRFPNITDAFFLDGGSSSTIVLQGKYLVPPIYFIDKARFSALLVKGK